MYSMATSGQIRRPMNANTLTRRAFTKRLATLTSAAFLTPGFTVNIISKPTLSDEVIGHGDFRYRIHKDWGNLDPSQTPVNNCHEMVQDARGRLLMIGDDVRNNVIIYDRSGRLLDTWGTDYPFGHGLTLWDAGGEEFLFLCDNGFDDNPQVVKTTLDGRVVMSLPHPKDVGAYAAYRDILSGHLQTWFVEHFRAMDARLHRIVG